jgi:hypothetical protein
MQGCLQPDSPENQNDDQRNPKPGLHGQRHPPFLELVVNQRS